MPEMRVLVVFLSIAGAAGVIFLCRAAYVRARALFQAANRPCRPRPGRAKVVHINGFDLCCKEAGADANLPPVIVVHGGPGMSGCYFKNAFEFLEADHRVISYDQRGSGFSQFKPEPAHYTLDELVNELEALRKKVAKSEKIIIIAHSFGGLVAMKYASEHGKHLEKMVLISPLCGKIRALDLIPAVLKMALSNGFPPAAPEALDNWLTLALPELFASSFYDRRTAGRLDIGYVSAAAMLAAVHSLRALGPPDFLEIFGKITVETLIISGKTEWVNTPGKDHLRLHAEIRGSRLVKFNKSGHWPFLEEPDKFKKTITRFLESGGAKRGPV